MAVLWTTACYRRNGPTSETYGRKKYTVDHSLIFNLQFIILYHKYISQKYFIQSFYHVLFNCLAMIVIDSTLKMERCGQIAAADATGHRRFLLSIYAHGLVQSQGGVPMWASPICPTGTPPWDPNGPVHIANGGVPPLLGVGRGGGSPLFYLLTFIFRAFVFQRH